MNNTVNHYSCSSVNNSSVQSSEEDLATDASQSTFNTVQNIAIQNQSSHIDAIFLTQKIRT